MTHNPGFVPDDLTSVDDVELKSVTQEGKRFSADDTAANEVRHRKLSDHVVPTSDDVTEEPDYGILSLIIPGYREKRNDFNEFAERTHFYQRLEQSFYVALTLAFSGYFITALFTVTDLDRGDYWCEGDGLLLVITGCTAIMMLYFLIVKQFYGEQLYHSVVEPLDAKYEMVWKIKKVIWRQVLWGLALQFILGLLILRWPVGRKLFECLGDKVAEFLAFTDEGSKFVFGDLLVVDDGGIFAFKVLPVTLFFSFCIQILYYYGIMQWVVLKLGWLLQVSIGTTACESTEAPLLIRPFIHLMTMSELHAVMTGGFATIAGSVMAAYISFGVSASHLLSASVMSAPAALAYSKLFYPETEPRAEIIATYALCGFSNIGSIGIQLGGIGALAPSRRPDIAKIVVRAMIAGNAACFLTACIA
ncbi:hypothetical protein HAZT_HAZT011173, partial [Hyalella azteca]